jgi:nicotinamidase-related amidase
MNDLKEEYLTLSFPDQELSTLIKELEFFPVRKRQWHGSIKGSALIVADLQNYFLSPSSHAFVPSAPAILPNIKTLIRIFRENNRPVIFTRHTNNDEDAGSMKYWWNDLVNKESENAALYPGLSLPGDIILEKHQYDAFHGTILEDLLKQKNAEFPVVCGVMANLCCETTVRSAFVKGFRPVLPVDGTAAYNRQFHLSTFRNLSFGFSPLLTTDQVIKQLLA